MKMLKKHCHHYHNYHIQHPIPCRTNTQLHFTMSDLEHATTHHYCHGVATRGGLVDQTSDMLHFGVLEGVGSKWKLDIVPVHRGGVGWGWRGGEVELGNGKLREGRRG
jgi:hypothetical protein